MSYLATTEAPCWLLQIDALLAGVAAADPSVCVGVVLVGLLGAAAAKDGGGVGGPKINWKHLDGGTHGRS